MMNKTIIATKTYTTTTKRQVNIPEEVYNYVNDFVTSVRKHLVPGVLVTHKSFFLNDRLGSYIDLCWILPAEEEELKDLICDLLFLMACEKQFALLQQSFKLEKDELRLYGDARIHVHMISLELEALIKNADYMQEQRYLSAFCAAATPILLQIVHNFPTLLQHFLNDCFTQDFVGPHRFLERNGFVDITKHPTEDSFLILPRIAGCLLVDELLSYLAPDHPNARQYDFASVRARHLQAETSIMPHVISLFEKYAENATLVSCIP